ncbi:MAG: adenosine deaminase [Acidobacteria bacterium]|nr:adenosine deaminase [Acidobacteriota bacterium]
MEPATLRPAAELHVHLRGAMPPAYFAQLLERHPPARALAQAPERHLAFFRRWPHLAGFLAPDAPAGADLFGFSTFPGFLASYLLSGYFVRTPADFRGLLDAVATDFVAQGLRYAEVTVSVPEYLMQGIPLEAVCEALSEASRRPDIRLRWIVDLVRNFGHDAALDLLRRLLARPPAGWVGVTLGGSEAEFPPGPFRESFELARAHGLGLTVHAGEAAGPESVWEALRELRVDRIGHGVRAVEDPRLVEHLAERGIPLEVCLTGNVKTGVFPSLAAHSLPQLDAAGVAFTLNTDDPTFFATTLAGEFEAARSLGISEQALGDALANVERFAFDRDACRIRFSPLRLC